MKPVNRNKTRQILETKNITCRLEDNTLFISGQLRVNAAGDFARAVLKEFRASGFPGIAINLEELDDIDSAGVTALFYVKRKLSGKIPGIRIEGGNANINRKIELFSSEIPIEKKPEEEIKITEAVGRGTYTFFTSYLYSFLLLTADTLYWAAADLFRAKTTREGEFVNQSVNIGVNAALIIIIMSFAIGFVMAVQSAQYLRDFGANIYIVDLVVIGIMSQMGPLITGVLVAGRSGSSIAAEVATMRVTAELDALKTMGLDPVRYVVVPKFYASLFTIPLLIILSNVSGIAGGASAAYYSLDITPEIFINRMAGVMQNKDLLTAFVKSQVYAGIIVLTGSFYGFRVERGAEGVGKVTTQAVVVSISLVILADSLMAVLFY
jgi:phospholipid/cholesterol/gamma-HCH transport system permease protein